MADVQERIKQLVTDNRVMLFMKGDRDFPQCGFSMRAVNIVNALGVNYETLNVLADNEVRQGIKEYANWPTIPQLYIDGEFQGGSDIVWELYQNGDLEKKVAEHTKVAE
ncbi:MAG: monothiol glutaredoxin [Myxococcota bacterium]|jgi:monothiol glutaredoxin